MKAMLLRVGIDTGTDGALAPIFRDGSFEYIPPHEWVLSGETRTFRTTVGRHGRALAAYLPPGLGDRTIHNDPDFAAFTYGDVRRKARALASLEPGDLLVFYAGLTPHRTRRRPRALYIIGYFTVTEVVDFSRHPRSFERAYRRQHPVTAHCLRRTGLADTVIVAGDRRRSALLRRAIPLSVPRPDRRGRPRQAVSPRMERLLGVSGSIQRSLPVRVIRDPVHLKNLLCILGLKKPGRSRR